MSAGIDITGVTVVPTPFVLDAEAPSVPARVVVATVRPHMLMPTERPHVIRAPHRPEVVVP